MHLDVASKLIPAVKGLATGKAGVRLLPCMYAPMPGELVLAVEAPPTKITRERPFSCMNHGMPSEMILLGEASPTNITVERFVTCMGPHVIQQLTPVTKTATTNITGTGLFPVGRSDMYAHPLRSGKQLTTHVTRNSLLGLGVGREMHLKF